MHRSCVVCVLVADFDVEEIMEEFTMEFNDVRNEYKKVRVEQQKIIFKYLKEKSFLNITEIHNKRGSNKYKSGGRFIEPYDLSNWLWIDLQINKVNFLVSLQAFDCDSSTGNMHVLMDRIGIYAYGGEYSPKEVREKMMITSINLPMNDEKEKMLENILEDLSKCDSFSGAVQLNNIKTKYNII